VTDVWGKSGGASWREGRARIGSKNEGQGRGWMPENTKTRKGEAEVIATTCGGRLPVSGKKTEREGKSGVKKKSLTLIRDIIAKGEDSNVRQNEERLREIGLCQNDLSAARIGRRRRKKRVENLI